MNKLIIRKKSDIDDIPWDLLLADPSENKVREYLERGNIYLALLDSELIGEYVLTNLFLEVMGLKNIEVDKNYQRKGIGEKLVLDAIERTKNQ